MLECNGQVSVLPLCVRQFGFALFVASRNDCRPDDRNHQQTKHNNANTKPERASFREGDLFNGARHYPNRAALTLCRRERQLAVAAN